MANQGKQLLPNTVYSVCMGIQCQIILVKFKFANSCELKTYYTRKKIDYFV